MHLKTLAFIDAHPSISITPEHKEIIQKAAPDSEILIYKSVDEMMNARKDADALFTFPPRTSGFAQWCENAPSLKWIHIMISGVDSVMSTEVGKMEKVRISSTKGIHGPSLSDTALAFIFSFLRQIPASVRSQMKNEWNAGIRAKCEESTDKTVGLIGLGAIGQEIARRCKLLGMRVIAAKRSPIDCQWVDECMSILKLDSLLEQSDFVILILPLTEESRNLIGMAQLKKMKKSAYLINLARGGILDHDALMEALRAGEIAGAALDTFEVEPLPAESPLWGFENIIISHHTSPSSPYYMDRAIGVASENIRRYLRDEPLLYEVDKKIGL